MSGTDTVSKLGPENAAEFSLIFHQKWAFDILTLSPKNTLKSPANDSKTTSKGKTQHKQRDRQEFI